MKAKEVREKGKEALEKLEGGLRQELAMARLQLRAGQLANTAKLGALKRDLARVLTILRSSQGGSK
jgi:large subunit ribosomal protein L29